MVLWELMKIRGLIMSRFETVPLAVNRLAHKGSLDISFAHKFKFVISGD